jgi:3-hydroxybutyryl-CoA dehydrogenase
MTRLDEITGTIRTVGVVGLGTMGAGIAQVALQSGYNVLSTDSNELALRRGKERIEGGLKKMAEKGKIPADTLPATLERLRLVAAPEEMGECDLVVEAVAEQEPIKVEIFRELDRVLKQEAILASNTSSISITRLAASRPPTTRSSASRTPRWRWTRRRSRSTTRRASSATACSSP